MPYVDKAETHWETCWRSPEHRACAVARVERLEEVLRRYEDEDWKDAGLCATAIDCRRMRERLAEAEMVIACAYLGNHDGSPCARCGKEE